MVEGVCYNLRIQGEINFVKLHEFWLLLVAVSIKVFGLLLPHQWFCVC